MHWETKDMAYKASLITPPSLIIPPSSLITLPRRHRRTPQEIAAIEHAMYRVLEEVHPRTVRNVFYVIAGMSLVQKTENEYNNTIVRLLTHMRKRQQLPFSWLADATRWMRKPRTYDRIEDALLDAARTYRRAVWRDMNAHVEIWTEKDAIASIMYEETSLWDVPLYAGRGYASHTYLNNAALYMQDIGKPAYIYYFGDYDPRGLDISRFIEQHIREYAKGIEIIYERVGLTREQIDRWQLPTRPTKKEKYFGQNFADESVDIDTVDPRTLREMVRTCITRHIDVRALEVLREAEEAERILFYEVVRQMTGQ
jgi:hypothetical protein